MSWLTRTTVGLSTVGMLLTGTTAAAAQVPLEQKEPAKFSSDMNNPDTVRLVNGEFVAPESAGPATSKETSSDGSIKTTFKDGSWMTTGPLIEIKGAEAIAKQKADFAAGEARNEAVAGEARNEAVMTSPPQAVASVTSQAAAAVPSYFIYLYNGDRYRNSGTPYSNRGYNYNTGVALSNNTTIRQMYWHVITNGQCGWRKEDFDSNPNWGSNIMSLANHWHTSCSGNYISYLMPDSYVRDSDGRYYAPSKKNAGATIT